MLCINCRHERGDFCVNDRGRSGATCRTNHDYQWPNDKGKCPMGEAKKLERTCGNCEVTWESENKSLYVDCKMMIVEGIPGESRKYGKRLLNDEPCCAWRKRQ